MAINKSSTSPAMKAVLILLIIAFVASFVTIGAGLFTNTNSGGNTQGAASNDPLASINSQFQPTVAAVTQSLQSDPESYTALVTLGNTYFDWAAQVQQASQTNTSAVGADQPLWTSAKDAYARAVAVNDKESAVRTDYAITLFYTGDTNKAVSVVTAVTKDDPNFPYAWFNLGIFKKALGDKQAAIAAFDRAVKLDPKGEKISLDYAKQQLTELRSNATTPTP